MKFRADDAWDDDWGTDGNDPQFPAGTAQYKGANIPVVAGDYTITLDLNADTYSFDPQMTGGGGFSRNIGIIGDATPGGWDTDTDMTYEGDSVWTIDVTLTDGEVKFRADDAWDDDWGTDGDDPQFPTGTAQYKGANIPVVAGDYTVTLDLLNDTYTFSPQDDGNNINSVGIIGDATPGGWDDDTDMADQGNGVYTITLTLTDGEVKFRANDEWDIAWGTADADNPEFPTGTAASPGENIPVTAGTYLVTLDTVNLTYNFELQ